MEKHIISIHEVKNNNNSQHCHVSVSVDGVPLYEDRELKDPFEGSSSHHEVAQYVEDRPDPTKSLVDDKCIHRYRLDLFKSLGLKDTLDGLKHPTIEINVCAYTNNRTDPSSRTSILSFYFELLELTEPQSQEPPNQKPHDDLEYWPSTISTVLVRRVILDRPFSERDLSRRDFPRTVPWSDYLRSTNDGSHLPTRCRVLLVIARDLVDSSEEPNPCFIVCTLLRLFERLNGIIQREFYQLEVVRPGSFAELKAHLESARDDPYQMVHLDMHGEVRCQKDDCRLRRNFRHIENSCSLHGDGQAFLAFAGNNHPAKEVASLLYANNIHCVALNACESANPNDGDDGNLAYTFVRHGISNVLAMSFQVSETMFAKYYNVFYEKLLEPNSNFSTAASHGRLELRRDRERIDPQGDVMQIIDYFVPVLYCNEKIAQMPFPEGDQRLRSTKQMTTHRYEYFSSFFSLCPFLRVPASTLVSCVAFGAMPSLRCGRRQSARDLIFNELNINMLTIEKKLKDCRFWFLHDAEDPDNSNLSTFLDNLIIVWRDTNFFAHIVVIPAAWFGQPAPVRVIRQWYCRLFHNDDCCQGEKLLENHVHSLENVIVIIKDFELLLQSRPGMLPRWLKTIFCESPQQQLIKFLERVFKNKCISAEADDYAASSGGGMPYLLLSANIDPKKFAYSEGSSNTAPKQSLAKNPKENIKDALGKLKLGGINLVPYDKFDAHDKSGKHMQNYINQGQLERDSLYCRIKA